MVHFSYLLLFHLSPLGNKKQNSGWCPLIIDDIPYKRLTLSLQDRAEHLKWAD